jgi:carboxymethylenebutenolidase
MIDQQIEIPTTDGHTTTKRPVYDRDAAERHWERLLSLYRRNLRS